MNEVENKLAEVFESIAWLDGITCTDENDKDVSDAGISFDGKRTDYFLLLMTLSMMLRYGDIQLTVVSDLSHKKQYFEKLLNGV